MSALTEKQDLTRSRSDRRLKDQVHGYTLHNEIKLVLPGKEFFHLLKQLIDKAKETIHLQTYIFDDDHTGRFIGDALIEAAGRKVQVTMLVDGYASQVLSKGYRQKMEEAGIQFRFFEPFFRSKHFYFGRRLHHKIVVIDNRESLVGSMNIADKYNDTKEAKAWLDMGIHIVGEVSAELQKICVQYWEGRKRKRRMKAGDGNGEKISYPASHKTPIRVRQNDWVNNKGQATLSYFQLFHNAKKSILVMCSYVLPGQTLRHQLVRASKRGVEIRFVLAGTSDVKVVKTAERYLYRWMLRHNMKLFEYQPTVLHTKMAIADGELMTIGSYNLNNLSAYGSVELNLDIKDPDFVGSVQQLIDEIIKKDCKPVDLALYTTHLLSWKQLMRWFAYHITRLAEKLMIKK